MSRKLRVFPSHIQDFLSITPYIVSMHFRSCEQLLLLWPDRGLRLLFAASVAPMVLEELFDEWQCHVVCAILVNKRRVRCPVNTGNWRRDEASFERHELIN